VPADSLLTFDRGDLVSRLHDEGDGVVQEHVPEGTRVRARVHAALAAELSPFATATASPPA
jgi:GTP-binding protein HflX